MEQTESEKHIKSNIIYGPVHSRRLGHSLGVNILPAHKKACSFDCVYCECGSAPVVSQADDSWPKPEEIEQALLSALNRDFFADYITFAGNGEPTLHPRFAEIVDRVIRVRDQYAPTIEIALLSNAALISPEHIRNTVARIDVPILKLDAGDERTLQVINRPAAEVTLEKILQGLKQLPHYFIQTLFVDGIVRNISEQNISAWLERCADLKPQGIQIYTLARPAAIARLSPVSRQILDDIAGRVQREIHIPVSVFGAQFER